MDCGPPGSSIHEISKPPPKKARFGETVHGQRLLRTEGWEGPRGWDEGQKASRLHEVWAGTTAPRPGRGHCPAPLLPAVCLPCSTFSRSAGVYTGTYWALDTAVCLQVCVRCGVLLMTGYNSGKWTERLGLIWLQGAEAIGPRARGQTRASEEGAQRIS